MPDNVAFAVGKRLGIAARFLILSGVAGCSDVTPADDGGAGEDDAGQMDAVSDAEPGGAKRLELLASDRASGDLFGSSVAVGLEVIVVGARKERTGGNDAGAAYVFTIANGTATETQKLTPRNPAAGSNFGAAVALFGDLLVVGAPSNPETASFAGSAYVFRRVGETWIEEQKLLASDGAQLDNFGVSVAIADDLIIVGADDTDNGGPIEFDAGSAYVFHYDGNAWNEVQKLLPSVPRKSGRFGRAVAVSASQVIVGAPFEVAQNSSDDLGAVYRFTEQDGVWSLAERLFDSEPDVGFGESLSLAGDLLAVAAPRANSNAGAVRLYRIEATSAQLVSSLTVEGATDFGQQAVTDGSTLIAFGDETGADSPRAAWRFDFDGADWIARPPLRPDETDGSLVPGSLAVGTAGVVIGVPNHAHDLPTIRHGAAYCE